MPAESKALAMAARVRVQQGGAQGELELMESEWVISAASSGGALPATGGAGDGRQRPEPWAATVAAARVSEKRGMRGTRERREWLRRVVDPSQLDLVQPSWTNGVLVIPQTRIQIQK